MHAVEEPPEGAQLADYLLADEELLGLVNMAAEIRRGLQVLRDSLKLQEGAGAVNDDIGIGALSEELQDVFRRCGRIS